MKIAVITSANLPVPAFNGGAVENLIDMYLSYNALNTHNKFVVYTILNKHHKDGTVKPNKYTDYYTINDKSPWYKIKRKIFRLTTKQYYSDGYLDFFLKTALDNIKHRNFDLIIVENRGEFVPRIKEVVNIPIMLHIHNEFHAALHRLPLAKIILSKCDMIVTISDYILNVMKKNYTNVFGRTVLNGVREEQFKNAKSDRKKFGFTNEDFVIVYCGRLQSQKGVKELIRGVKIASKTIPHIKLLIIGGANFGDKTTGETNQYTEELKTEVKDIQEMVKFTGFIPYNEVSSGYASSDIAVVPSTWNEPAGQTAVEPMFVGIPLIVTKSGGLPQMVENAAIQIDKNPETLPQQISNAIIDLYNNPAKRLDLIQKGKKRREALTAEKYGLHMMEAIETCVKKSKKQKHN